MEDLPTLFHNLISAITLLTLYRKCKENLFFEIVVEIVDNIAL